MTTIQRRLEDHLLARKQDFDAQYSAYLPYLSAASCAAAWHDFLSRPDVRVLVVHLRWLDAKRQRAAGG